MRETKICISLSDFLDFLVCAKKSAYAGQGKKIKRRDTSRHYFFKNQPFCYHDTYFGNIADCGREVVYVQSKPIWGMCYYGGATKEAEKNAKEIFDFLRMALLRMPHDFPSRGPLSYSNVIYQYSNVYAGSILDFNGTEEIKNLNSGALVYIKHYCGGLIRDRSYSVIFKDGGG